MEKRKRIFDCALCGANHCGDTNAQGWLAGAAQIRANDVCTDRIAQSGTKHAAIFVCRSANTEAEAEEVFHLIKKLKQATAVVS